jgi:hypothetical protein
VDFCQPHIVTPKCNEQLVMGLLHLDAVCLQLLHYWNERAVVFLAGFVAILALKLQDAPHVPGVVVYMLAVYDEIGCKLACTPGSKSFVTEIDRNLLISVLNEIVPFNAPKIDSVHAKHG